MIMHEANPEKKLIKKSHNGPTARKARKATTHEAKRK
jgi:hypothetical protein